METWDLFYMTEGLMDRHGYQFGSSSPTERDPLSIVRWAIETHERSYYEFIKISWKDSYCWRWKMLTIYSIYININWSFSTVYIPYIYIYIYIYHIHISYTYDLQSYTYDMFRQNSLSKHGKVKRIISTNIRVCDKRAF